MTGMAILCGAGLALVVGLAVWMICVALRKRNGD